MKIVIAGFFLTLLNIFSIAGYGQQMYVQTGHTASIAAIAFSPDNRTFATAGEDKTVKLFDAATGAEFLTLTGHTGGVSSIAFSPDGKTLASGSYDGSVRLWDVAAGKEIPFLTERLDKVTSVAFSPDGRSIAAGAWNGIYLIDVKNKQKKHYGGVQTLETCCRVLAVAFSTDGKKVIFGGQEFGKGFVRIAYLPSGEIGPLGGSYNDEFPPVYALSVSTDNLSFAVGTRKGTRVVRFDKRGVEPPEGKWIEKTEDMISMPVVFHPTSNLLITGNRLSFFNIITGRKTKSLDYAGFAHAISPDGKTLVAVNTAKEITIWDTVSGKLKQTIKPVAQGYSSVWLDREGKFVAGITMDKSAVVWDLIRGGEPQKQTIPIVPSVSLNSDASADGEVKISVNSIQGGFNEIVSLNGVSAVIEPNETILKMRDSENAHDYFKSVATEHYIYDESGKTYNRRLLETNAGINGKFLIAAVTTDGKKLATLAVSDSERRRTASIAVFDINKEERKFTEAVRNIFPYNYSYTYKNEKPNGYFTSLAGHFVVSLDYEKEITESISDKEAELSKIVNEVSRVVPQFRFKWDALRNRPSAGNGKFRVKLSENSTIKILAGEMGTVMANLYSFGEKDWLVTTPEGYFDGSAGALKQMIWRHNNKILPYEEAEFYAKQFNYPGLLPALMTGGGFVKKEITPIAAAVLFDEFGLISNGEIKARVDRLFAELNNNPAAAGHIISYRQQGKTMQTRLIENAIRSYLGFRGFDASRISFIKGGLSKRALFEFYIVPPGADSPKF